MIFQELFMNSKPVKSFLLSFPVSQIKLTVIILLHYVLLKDENRFEWPLVEFCESLLVH